MAERLDFEKMTKQMIDDLAVEIDSKTIIADYDSTESKEKATPRMSVLEAAVDKNLTDISKIKSELEITGPDKTLEYQIEVLVTSNLMILELIEQGIKNKNIAFVAIEQRKEMLQSEYGNVNPQKMKLLSDAVFHSRDLISEF